MRQLSNRDQKNVRDSIEDIAADAGDTTTAAAKGFQCGATQALETVLRECSDELSPAAVREIKDVLRDYDEAAPYGFAETWDYGKTAEQHLAHGG